MQVSLSRSKTLNESREKIVHLTSSALSPNNTMAPADSTPLSDPPIEKDDPFLFLANFDTIFLIDDSGSMDAETPSRWHQVGSTLSKIAPICTQHDEDGIDIHFLNKGDKRKFKHITRYPLPFVLTLSKAANHEPLSTVHKSSRKSLRRTNRTA